MASFALAFDSSAFSFALAFDWNQMRLYYCRFIMVILLVGFVWNKPQEDQ